MHRKRSIMLAAVMAVAVAGPAAAGPTGRDQAGNDPQGAKDQTKSSFTVLECSDDDEIPDTVTTNADLIMWPPNHKYQDIDLTAAGDADASDVLNYFTTTVSHDEYVTEVAFNDTDGDNVPDESGEEPEEEVGAGNTQNDAKPPIATTTADGSNTATNKHQVRSERSGRGDGRTYTVTAYAMWDDSEEGCSASYAIEVPHDMRSSKAPAKEDKTGTTGPNNGGGGDS